MKSEKFLCPENSNGEMTYETRKRTAREAWQGHLIWSIEVRDSFPDEEASKLITEE